MLQQTLTPHPEAGRGKSKEALKGPQSLDGGDGWTSRGARAFIPSQPSLRLTSPSWVSDLCRKRMMLLLSPGIMGRDCGGGGAQAANAFCQHLWFLQYPARLLAIPQGRPCSSRHPPFPINGKWLGSRLCAWGGGGQGGRKETWRFSYSRLPGELRPREASTYAEGPSSVRSTMGVRTFSKTRKSLVSLCLVSGAQR